MHAITTTTSRMTNRKGWQGDNDASCRGRQWWDSRVTMDNGAWDPRYVFIYITYLLTLIYDYNVQNRMTTMQHHYHHHHSWRWHLTSPQEPVNGHFNQKGAGEEEKWGMQIRTKDEKGLEMQMSVSQVPGMFHLFVFYYSTDHYYLPVYYVYGTITTIPSSFYCHCQRPQHPQKGRQLGMRR